MVFVLTIITLIPFRDAQGHLIRSALYDIFIYNHVLVIESRADEMPLRVMVQNKSKVNRIIEVVC